MHPTVVAVTDRIRERSRETRRCYLDRIRAAEAAGPSRRMLSCGNLAHGYAACGAAEKQALAGDVTNVAIVSAYNDMLSAHQPFERFPALIREAVAERGAVAQFAGGVPAMCDGVTQGQPGMELSLFSRDTIAMATAIALSHNMFDAALYLGVCDKIVPGLLIGALSFGHLPALFVPAGPMPSGISNDEKARVRQLFAEGKVGREELLRVESESYHSPGTCTFYGTANSNQMLMEMMGLHLPGTSFINPNTPLRDALTKAAAQQVLKFTYGGNDYRPLGELVDERAIVNGVIGLLATGGSTNHTLHIVAMARAAGILLDWRDFDELSRVTPLLTRVYPSGSADVNHFHAAGGMAFLIGTLLDGGLLHEDIITVADQRGLRGYACEPFLDGERLTWRPFKAADGQSLDSSVLRPGSDPFSPEGGLRLLEGNLGRAVVKVSAVKPEHRVIEAPAVVFNDQHELIEAFQAGALDRDFVAVVRFQGPKANGMPELHQLTPPLGVLQDRGHRVALVTDGRMSGASGKVLAAIHVTPEAIDGGLLARVQNGDRIRIDAERGELMLLEELTHLNTRLNVVGSREPADHGMGRELFSIFRHHALPADQGGGVVGTLAEPGLPLVAEGAAGAVGEVEHITATPIPARDQDA